MRLPLNALLLGFLTFVLAAGVPCLPQGLAQNQPPNEEPVEAPDPPAEPVINGTPGFLANVAVDHANGKYRGGEKMSVQFMAEKDAHVYLLYQQVDGKTLMLFPNKARPDNFLKAKTKVSIPEPGQPFRFRIQAPFGEEWLQVVASTKPIECLAKLDTSAGKAVPLTKETLDELTAQIKQNPTDFAEHRVKLQTEEGDAPLPPARPAARAALLIGVSKAKQLSVRPRYKNAPVLMADLFVKHCGVDPQKLRLLIDEDSSKAKIEDGITQWLPSVTQPGDVVFIYYHGHGGRIPNLDGSEPDLHDECLWPSDWEQPTVEDPVENLKQTRERVILDDTLARWLQELPGRQIVLLLDTCHSGGAVDSLAANRFFVNEGERIRDISQLNTTVITTALADEVSWGGTSAPDAISTFSHFFQEAMEKLPKPVTLKQAYEYYKKAAYEYYLTNPITAGQQEPSYTNHAVLDVELVPKPASQTP